MQLTRQEAENLLPQDTATKVSSKMKSVDKTPTIEHEYEVEY